MSSLKIATPGNNWNIAGTMSPVEADIVTDDEGI
jgi:hypothetical protein